MNRLTPQKALATITAFGVVTLAAYKISILGGTWSLWMLVVFVEVARGILMFSQAILRGKNQRAGNIGFRASIVFTFAIALAGWYATQGKAEAIYFQIANAEMLMLEFIFARLVERPTVEMVSKAEHEAALADVVKWKGGYDSAMQEILKIGNELGVIRGRFEDANKRASELGARNSEMSAEIERLQPLAALAEKYAKVIERVGIIQKHKGNYRVICTCGEMHSIRGQKRIECACGEVWEYGES